MVRGIPAASAMKRSNREPAPLRDNANGYSQNPTHRAIVWSMNHVMVFLFAWYVNNFT